MKKIEQFDQYYKQYFKDDITLMKTIIIIFLCIGLVVMLIPAQVLLFEIKTAAVLGLNIFYLSMVAQYYVMPYMGSGTSRNQKNRVSIYKILQYMPIDEEEIMRSRFGYLLQFVKKLVIIWMIEQVLSSLLLTKSIHIVNILVPLLYGGWMLFVGVVCIMPGRKRVGKVKVISKDR